MSGLSCLRRVLQLVIATALPIAAFGYLLGGYRGASIAALVSLLGMLIATYRAERGLLRIYRVREREVAGPRRSLDRVMDRIGGDSPRVFSFSDPSPQALVVRGLAGPGSILLSEGLLGALSEEELRELLKAAVSRLRAPGSRLQTLCAWLAHGVFELAPRPWLELFFGELRWHERLSPLGALRFLVVFATARFFIDLGRLASVDAPRSIQRLPVVAGEVANPGSWILHFSNPWSDRSLLPL